MSLVTISPLRSVDQIKDYITARAIDNDASVATALAIVEAESGFNVHAKNASSTASGIAQFIDGTFRKLCINEYKLTDTIRDKNDPYIQIECLVRRLAENGGSSEWQASKPFWQKLIWYN